jgi:propionyl-CoA carboxylase alpha chain
MQHPRFRSGELTTGFIAEEYPEGFHGAPASPNSSARWPGSPRSWPRHGPIARAASTASWAAGCVRRRTGRSPSVATFAVALTADEVTVDGAALDLSLEYTPGDRLVEAEVDGVVLGVKVAHAQRLRADHARRDPQGAGPARPRGAYRRT